MEKINDILSRLNDEQIKPVLCTEGPVLVLAGAGSGKTRVLTSRIAYLVAEKRVRPENILAITFTNKAANEMKERINNIVNAGDMWICTIHSMCVRILRMFATEAGLTSNFSIYSETERANIIKQAFKECDYDDTDGKLKNFKWHIANAKMLGKSPAEYQLEYSYEQNIKDVCNVYTKYQAHLKENNALDFDDLLNETRNLLNSNKEAREFLSDRFHYILVDEFQDTNSVQYEIIRRLSSCHNNLFVVGDDDQSIYGWRGAEIENILNFERDFKGTKTFKLERNYRSTKKILKVANAVIHHNGNRKEKTLWTENDEGVMPGVYEKSQESDEARFVANTISELVYSGYKYSDIAILMRLNALSRSFEQEFSADAIPFKVFGGFKFYERKEIKDLLAYLRLVNNPFDSEALIRIINFPKRGVGAKTIEELQKYAEETDLSVYDAILDIDSTNVTSKMKVKLKEFGRQIRNWIVMAQDSPINELVKAIVVDTGMREAYADNSDDSINKVANIDEFVNSVEEYNKLNPTATLTDYLNQITLSSDTDDMDDGNYVTLATVHSVKGLEFKCVFICGMEDNVFPISRAEGNDDEIEEERRLLYVAVTRAKERLYFTRAESRYLYGHREPTMRSRFLKELSSILKMKSDRSTIYDDNYGFNSDDDPDFYGNNNYGASRFQNSNSRYGGYNNYSNNGYSNHGNNYGGNYGNSGYNNSGYRSSYSSGGSGSLNNGFNRTKASTKSSVGAITFGGVGSKPKNNLNKDTSSFKIGMKVEHPKFGIGTIIDVKKGENVILHIAFEKVGIKALSAALAPLKIIG